MNPSPPKQHKAVLLECFRFFSDLDIFNTHTDSYIHLQEEFGHLPPRRAPSDPRPPAAVSRCPGHVSLVSQSCLGGVLFMFGRCLGHVLLLLCLGHVCEVSRSCLCGVSVTFSGCLGHVSRCLDHWWCFGHGLVLPLLVCFTPSRCRTLLFYTPGALGSYSSSIKTGI